MEEIRNGASTDMACNLLAEQIIRIVTTTRRVQSVSLPELLAQLMADQVESLPALRPHQKQALHCFLAQLGAMALLMAGESEPPHDADRWAELLRGLTPGFDNDEPWCLVVGDWTKPAFMQAPVPEGSWTPPQKDPIAETPDQIDIPSTSKNHDRKSFSLVNNDASAWLFSIIALQTQQGPFGKGNHGISRMKSGGAFRPFVGASKRSANFGTSVHRDILELLRIRPTAMASSLYTRPEIALLWLVPWDGATQLPLNNLDPYYIEICRRIRLARDDTRIIAQRSTSHPRKEHGKRIAVPKTLNETLGDPWAPIKNASNPEVFSVRNKSFKGIGYKLIAELLDPRQYTMSPLGRPRPGEFPDGLDLVFMMLPRDEGKTYGYHEKRVTISPEVVDVLSHDPSSTKFSDIANSRVNDVSKASAALELALFGLERPPEDLKHETVEEIKKSREFKKFKGEAKTKVVISRFEDAVDEDFFERLFEEVAKPVGSDEAKACRESWIEKDLWPRARDALAAAEAGSPLSGVRRYRARAAAQALLDGAIVNAFPDHLKRRAVA